MNACRKPRTRPARNLPANIPFSPDPDMSSRSSRPSRRSSTIEMAFNVTANMTIIVRMPGKKTLKGAVVSPLFSTLTATKGVSLCRSMADATASSISASETSSPWSAALDATTRFACSSAACFAAAPRTIDAMICPSSPPLPRWRNSSNGDEPPRAASSPYPSWITVTSSLADLSMSRSALLSSISSTSTPGFSSIRTISQADSGDWSRSTTVAVPLNEGSLPNAPSMSASNATGRASESPSAPGSLK